MGCARPDVVAALPRARIPGVAVPEPCPAGGKAQPWASPRTRDWHVPLCLLLGHRFSQSLPPRRNAGGHPKRGRPMGNAFTGHSNHSLDW